MHQPHQNDEQVHARAAAMSANRPRRKRTRRIVLDSSSDSSNSDVEVIDVDNSDVDFEPPPARTRPPTQTTLLTRPPRPNGAPRRRVRVLDQITQESEQRTPSPPKVALSCLPLGERERTLGTRALVMSSRKQRELCNWLERAISATSNVPRTLLLCGPPGCGKWTALRTLLAERALVALQWEPPAPSARGGVLRPLLESLHAFLTCSRYPSLSTEGRASSSARVIVLRDLPVALADAPMWRAELQALLSAHVRASRTPTVVVLSDSARGVARALRLVGAPLLESPFVATIRVPPPSALATRRALVAVARKERIAAPSGTLDALSESANGDIRAALNELHLSCAAAGSGSRSRRPQKRPRPGATQAWVSKDGTLGTYHAVSKILNNKRDAEGRSKYDAEQVLEDAQAEPGAFLAFLHQNYPDFFGGGVDEVASALDALSDADVLMAWHSDHLQRSCLTDCAASLVTRAFFYYNKHAVRSGWRPIRGPDSYAVGECAKEFVERARKVLPGALDLQVFGRSSVLDSVAYGEKIAGVRVSPWYGVENSAADPDIAMVEAEEKDQTFRAMVARSQRMNLSGRCEDFDLKGETSVGDIVTDAVGEEEIEEWESDAG